MAVRTVVGITGAEGELGGMLRRQLWDQSKFIIRAFSRTPKTAVAGAAPEGDGGGQIGFCHECRTVDLAADGAFVGQLNGCDAVIHLAALARPWEPYSAIHSNNMIADHALYEEAARAGCRRVVFASTNHVQVRWAGEGGGKGSARI